jgi:hypothetical protein
MKLLMIAAVLALSLASLAAVGTETCFLESEQDAGMNKICFYSCVSGDAAITIKAVQLCPLSIKR